MAPARVRASKPVKVWEVFTRLSGERLDPPQFQASFRDRGEAVRYRRALANLVVGGRRAYVVTIVAGLRK